MSLYNKHWFSQSILFDNLETDMKYHVRIRYKIEIEKKQMILIKTQEELMAAHTEIQKVSVTDQLTKCYNRYYLDEQFNHEIGRAKRYDHPLSLIL